MTLEGVEHVDGLPVLLDEVHSALGGKGRPDTAEAVAQELLLFETGGGEGLDRVIDFERQHTRLSLRLAPGGVRGQHVIAQGADAIARASLPAGTTVTTASMTTLLGGWIDEIVDIVQEHIELQESAAGGYYAGRAVIQERVTDVMDVMAMVQTVSMGAF